MESQLAELGVDQTQLTEIRTYATFSRRLKRFRDNSTLHTFNQMFDENGERLFRHFLEVNQDFQRFLTYLTQRQINIIYSYVINNYKGD